MDANAWMWMLLIAGALLSGASFVGILVIRQRSEALSALFGIVCFSLSAWSLTSIAEVYGRADAVVYAFALMLAALAGGWALASSLLERLVRPVSPLVLPSSLPEDAGTAVVLVACSEPEFYTPAVTAQVLQSLTDEGLLEPSLGVLPFLFFAQKARYRAVGGVSPSAAEISSLSELLGARLGPLGIARVDWAACGGPRRLAERVLLAASKGHRRIVIARLGVAGSLELAAAERETDALRLETLGVAVTRTDFLADSDLLASAVVHKILGCAADLSGSGVVLLGHGQPESVARRNPDYDELETRFLNRIRMLLLDEGIAENHIRLAWSEWREPDVTSSVRHLAALGCSRVIVVPAVYPLDTLITRLDLELEVKQARVDQAVLTVTLAAWKDDPAVLDELESRIKSATDA